jgi:ribose 5-phosphate isomerase A
MTIVERAMELITDGSRIGLGSGRAAQAFIRALGERVRSGRLHVYGVPTSKDTETLAMQEDLPLLTLEQAGMLDLTVDGADEVDPNFELIKGYGRALVRERSSPPPRAGWLSWWATKSWSRAWDRAANCRSR